ncbi:MAG: hypothetical protein R3224_09190 [Balneolaceae bacterium]|nr:hypothetical protein [Balneolaceae bacterium]
MVTSSNSRNTKSAFSYFRSRQNILLVLICSVGLVLASCSDNSTGTTNGGGGNGGDGDGNGGSQIGTEPTFTNIQDLFTANCGGSGCHIGNTTSGVRLDSYDDVINSQGLQYNTLIVQPGDADNSPLIDKLEPNPQFGVRMPNGRTPLTDDRIAQIRTWINEGAENN